MTSLTSQELKFFFTSPLFMSLELAPVILITILGIAGPDFKGPLQDIIPPGLLPIVWLMMVFYSTYFELELWRKGFLSKSVKLKFYTTGSPYAPFLEHSVVSIVLLELKTLIFVLPYFLLKNPGQILVFFFATHVNWLFSLSIGSIFSKEVFNKMKDSTETFLCILIFNAIIVLIVNSQVSSQGHSVLSLAPYWPTPSLENEGIGSLPMLPSLAVLFTVLMLFIVAVYVNSTVVKGLRMDGS